MTTRRLHALAALFLALVSGAWASPAEAGPGPDLDLYARLLARHTVASDDVVGTRVDYRALADSADWKRLVRSFESARPGGMSRDERLAYWINAYNVFAIDLVLDHYPVEGIREIGSFFSPVWNVEVATIEGRTLSLGGIEHDILREMGEPRIHGAIVCASVSCPPLARTPFRAETIDADLTAAMRRWLAIPGKGLSIDRRAGRVRVSKVFDWFDDDFEAQGGIPEALLPFLDDDDAAWIRAQRGDLTLRYLDYDWSLNDVQRASSP